MNLNGVTTIRAMLRANEAAALADLLWERDRLQCGKESA